MVLSLEIGWGMELLARVGRAAGRATLRHRAIEAISNKYDCWIGARVKLSQCGEANLEPPSSAAVNDDIVVERLETIFGAVTANRLKLDGPELTGRGIM